jgi:hypothetical protein
MLGTFVGMKPTSIRNAIHVTTKPKIVFPTILIIQSL